MTRWMTGFLALALLASGCAKAQLKKEPNWGRFKEAAAVEAKAGRFHASMDRMMDVALYMFETEGLMFGRRDDDSKTFTSEILKLGDPPVDHFLELKFIQEEGGVVSAKWTHYAIIKYKNVDQCLDNAACQTELTDDWNWRLYKHLR
jgi:hypothetical protein